VGQKLDFSFKLLKDWRELEYLIVDEVSMLTPKTFQKMDIFLKQCRRNDRPMGGLRMVLVGDF
jgi:ATP-dependent DNA helicase PIF1